MDVNGLIAGMATQVFFGSCDAATARFVSQSLGRSTERIRTPGKRFDGSPHDPQVRQPDITRARTLLGWEPKVTLEEGLTSTIDYFRRKLG